MLLRLLAKEDRSIGIGSAHPQPLGGRPDGRTRPHVLDYDPWTSRLVAEDLRNATTINFSATCRGGQQRNACYLQQLEAMILTLVALRELW